MKKLSTAVALVAGLSAASASAQVLPNHLQGSDTMFNMMRDLSTRLSINSADLLYVGGGSGTGVTGMKTTNRQEIAPASRELSSGECSGHPAGQIGYAVAGDNIINVAAVANTCTALNWGTTITAQDLNGTAGIDGAASTTLADWRTIMRIIYMGRTVDGVNSSVAADVVAGCNSDLRHTIVKNWTNIFKDCVGGTCTALKHAFRRDDQSGTTDAYLELLGVPSGQRFTAVPAPTVSPFCNGFESQDNDPIRVTCQGTGFNGAGDESCGLAQKATAGSPNPAFTDARNFTLGVVLPVIVPSEDPYADRTVDPATGAALLPHAPGNCAPLGSVASAFANVPWTTADVLRYGGNCPDGLPAAGSQCAWPKKTGTPAGQGFGCVSKQNDRPTGVVAPFDGRVYNLWTRRGDGAVISYQRASATRMNHAFYRIHQLGTCTKADATDQIACFVVKDPCSIGYAGLSALDNEPNAKALQIRTVNAPFANIAPPSCANFAAQFANYGLARKLYVHNWDNFASVGSQPASFVAAQQTIWNAVTSSSADVSNAAVAAGFCALPAPFDTVACP